ncbi:MAG: hypothetical protein IPI46_07275 [Bacteroidetes bacterium]|nr:hypothetical protein [Bacteroidota bacterium]
MFQGRKLIIATKHEKEKAIAPILEKELGVHCITVPNFDSDLLGTFTGEIEREDEPLETARKKCLLAMELANSDLAIASEGSFGPHPSIFFAYADDEILLFIDKKNDLEIFIRVLSTDTNFNVREVNTIAELKDFAIQCQFPAHALIVKKSKNDFSDITKGITDWNALKGAVNHLLETQGSAYIETDMRAMYNPTRMQVIAQATQKLANKINSYCPVCHAPGLGITAIKEGLPCNQCSSPTHSIISYLYGCQKCNYEKEEMFPNQKETEDPMYCDNCNP